MTIDKEKLSKLSPEERLKKLELLKKAKAKEVKEIEQLIQESTQKLKAGKLAEEITPEHREVDITRLFEHASGEDLEGVAAGAAREAHHEPAAYERIAQLYHDYTKLMEFYGAVASGNPLTKEQMNAIGKIGERLNIAEKYLTESEKTASKLDPSKSVLYKLKKDTGLD